MATAEENRRRNYWRWLRAGGNQIMPYPEGSFDISDMYMLNGFINLDVIPNPCVPTEWQEIMDGDTQDVFLDDFAVDARYVTASSVVFIIRGIFNEPYKTSNPGLQVGLQSQDPTFRVDENDLPSGGVARGDRLFYCGKVYEIHRNEPDGTGINELILHEVK